MGVVEGSSEVPSVRCVAGGELEQKILFAQVFGGVPRPVVAHELGGVKKANPAVADRRASGQKAAAVAVGSGGDRSDVGGKFRVVEDLGAACGGKVALVGKIGAFFVVEPVDELGDHGIQVHVAVPVGVGGEVHGNPVDGGRKIGAVVEVEAAHVILVGFAVAGVLGDDHARDGFEDFSWAQQGFASDLAACGRAFGSRVDGRGVGRERKNGVEGRNVVGACQGAKGGGEKRRQGFGAKAVHAPGSGN